MSGNSCGPRCVHAVVLAIVVGLLYLLSANYGPGINVDSEASALAAWSLAKRGSLVLSEFSDHHWVVPSSIGPVSNRPPGTFLAAVPFYLFAPGFSYSPVPSTVCAVVCATLCILFCYLIFARYLSSSAAAATAMLFAFGTATWGISANQLWPHAVTQLALVVALWCISKGLFFVSGVALGYGVLARAPIAVVIPFLFIALLYLRTDYRRILAWLFGLAPGIVGLFVYNRFLFQSLRVAGGYAKSFESDLVSTSFLDNITRFLDALVGSNGIFVWSPFIVVTVFGMRAAWKGSGVVERAAFIAGIAYLLVHVRIGRVSGGLAFNYRYPLETITLMAPLLALSLQAIWGRSKLLRYAVAVTVALSVLLQALFVFGITCEDLSANEVMCTLL